MIYSLELRTVFLVVGAFLLAGGLGLGLFRESGVRWMGKFPRSKVWGASILGAVAVWAWLLVAKIDLGEFSPWRPRLLLVIPVMAILTLLFVDEFLAVRALGMLVLLAAKPVLDAAWMRPETSRLLLVGFTYVCLTFSLFWIGMPYTLRDQIGWVTRSAGRVLGFAIGMALFGAVLISLGLRLHH
jgi:hypothetical protein